MPVDFERAAEHYGRAAEKGDTRAQVALGGIYQTGQGMPADAKHAAKLFKQAAEQGEPRALSTLRCSISAAKA